jgi:hypothetical protein
MTQRMGLIPFLLMFVGVFAACPSFNQTGLPNAPNQNAQLPRQAAMPSNVAPIFDANPGHPWDQVREIFYARRFATGETFYDPHAFAPPWTEFRAFVSDVAFHEQVVALLQAVQQLPPAEMEEQPAFRRLIFLRDLWAAFDGVRNARVTWLDATDEASAQAVRRRDELLRRVAGIMKRLELTEGEVRALPDALLLIGEKKLYPNAFDPKSPLAPFFPTDLLDEASPWVTYSRYEELGTGGEIHQQFADFRSLFTLHLLSPDGHQGGIQVLREFTESKGTKSVPAGTTLALLRRALVPARNGKLLVSPVVESLQLIVVASPQSHFFKFTLDRTEFLAGRPGLMPITRDHPAGTSGYELFFLGSPTTALPGDERKENPNGEGPVLGKYKRLRDVPSALETCVVCHGTTDRQRLFGSSAGNKVAFLDRDPEQTAAFVVTIKQSKEDWKLYLRLREEAGK